MPYKDIEIRRQKCRERQARYVREDPDYYKKKRDRTNPLVKIAASKRKIEKDRWRSHNDPEWRARRTQTNREWRIKNREKYLMQRKARLRLKQYGITTAQYKEMVSTHKNMCAICGKEGLLERWNRLCIDHDHKTGKIRGLLCNSCNLGIAYLKGDVSIFVKAVLYLKKNSS